MLQKILAWLKPCELPFERPVGQRCGTCGWYDDFSNADPEEPVGYCMEPHNAAANHPYAGSWEHSEWWCRHWKART